MNHSFKIFYRNLLKKPVFSVITLVSFMLAIFAVCFIGLWMQNELSHDKFHPDYDRIYRVLTLSKQGDKVVKSTNNYRPVAKILKADFPQIAKATYLSYNSENEPLQKMEGGEKIEEKGVWTSADFFEVFQGFQFVEGDVNLAFSNAENVVLSEKVAKKLFGNQPALGQTIVSNKYQPVLFKVSAVVRIPENSHFDFGFLYSDAHSRVKALSQTWTDEAFVRVYIKLSKEAVIDDEFLSAMSHRIKKYTLKTDKLLFQPLANIHLYSDYESLAFDKHLSHVKYLSIFAGLALIIVLMASFNFGALTVARFADRYIEMGVKKASGASRSSLVKQLLFESFLQTFFASLLAFFLVKLCLPLFNQISGQNLIFILDMQLIAILVFIILIVAIASALYPIIAIAHQNSMHLLRKTLQTKNLNFYNYISAILFFTCMILMVFSSVLVKQLHFVSHKKTGLIKENVLVIPTGLWYENQAFKDELLRHPNILAVSASGHAPVNIGWKSNFKYVQNGQVDSLNLSWFFADEDFALTYGLTLKEGDFFGTSYSDFPEEFGSDNPSNHVPVVVNEAAAKALGFRKPIGQHFGNHFIVGVVKDFNFRPLHHSISPMVIQYDPQNMMTMNVKIVDGNKSESIDFIKSVYQKHNNQRAFEYQYFDTMLAKEYKQEVQLRNLLLLFALLSVVLSMLGVFGMTWFAIEQRTKEIGIRKVNGARVSQLLYRLNAQFFKWILVVITIAIPISVYFSKQWLNQFAYKTVLSWWLFVLAGGITLLIVLLVVSWKAYQVANKNPVESLRYE